MINDDIWRIYEESIPVRRQRPREKFPKLCVENLWYHQDIIVRNDINVGLMFYWKTDKFTYIEHFAVSDKFRNMGIGGQALDDLVSKNRSIVVEVEPPESDENAMRLICFFRRHGLKLSSVSFLHPGYQKGTRAFELRLMTYPEWNREDFQMFFKFLDTYILKRKSILSC